jgi:dimethylglycine dehydrogenase
MPIFAELGIQREVHGAISHPPDGNPLIGPAPGVKNYWCCCGTQIGIGWGPGLTRELAKWMVRGSADINMRDYDPRRFGAYAKKDWQVIKAHEDYKLRHEIPFPHFNRLEGRPIKPSPLYEMLKEKGAVYEEVFGHERPRWFARDGVEQRDHYSFRRNEVFDMVAAECKAVRERVGIMDVTAFTKVMVEGPDAYALLDRLTANKMPQKHGSITLTHMLNRRGRIELETTIVRMADDKFYLVCAAFFEQRLMDHLNHNRASEDVTVTALSEDWSALSLNGPRSRDVLAQCTEADLSNTGFRWLSAQEITVAGHKLWAFRMSYAGALGWELHMPDEACVDVYNALWAAGEAHGIENYGSFAMNSLRMEKAFPGAGELTNEVTLPEANVMRFVKLDKDYLGIEATRASAEAKEQPWICAYLEIDPDGVEDGHGGEAIRLNGEVVGATASVAYGHTVGKILGFAYIKPHAATPGTELEIIIAGEPRIGRILGEPAYDPQSLLPRTDAVMEAAE